MHELLIPSLLLFVGVLCRASADEPPPTYKHVDRLTGETLNCAKCPPGTHMTTHCTASAPTACTPCGADHFTELWNYLPKCLYCNNFCGRNQEVESECSPISNRVCRCKEGFYVTDGFCMIHKVCALGYGVQTKGTSQTNTVCQKCSPGYFSSSSSALDSCVKHKECVTGQVTFLNGSVYYDKVCGSCEDLANGDGWLRSFLSGFFSMHRIGVCELRRFVSRYICRANKEGQAKRITVPKKRDPLLHHIRNWLAEVPEEQLQKVPQMLNDAQLTNMAVKLEKKLEKVKGLNCT
ncbi:tumor necrosis factor receptor superfamily member 6B-like [Aulostomus maculatus]